MAQDASQPNLKLLRESLPKYPKNARKEKLEGIVKLRLTIAKDGTVASALVISGDPILADAAHAAIWKRLYEPPPAQASQSIEPQIETAICFILTKQSPLIFGIDDPEEEAAFSVVLTHRGGLVPPRVIYAPDPPYTEAARRDKLQGVSILELIIDEKGQARYARLVKKLGDGLDENAIATIRQWKFQPATKDSQPVPSLATVEIAFHL